MIRFFQILLTVLITSLFLFPLNLPIVGFEMNTKMVLAVIGVALLLLDKINERGPLFSKDFLILTLICLLISLWSYTVTLQNIGVDNSFVTYFISVWVWLGAAYAIIWLIKAVHGEVSVKLIGDYLIGVCVFQCVLAYSMSLWPPLNNLVILLMRDSYTSLLEGRLFGLGAALDPAGLRFSGVLVIIAWLILKTNYAHNKWTLFFYILSFILISVVGNMIARTTTVGMVIGLVVLTVGLIKGGNASQSRFFWSVFTPTFLVLVFLIIWLYHISPSFRAEMRFGFEGFFSLVEKGRWEVHSNNVLKGMIVWPETLKTWIIGDGYFVNPSYIPDRFGQTSGGYYMHTDIGYLRYIFYFGTVGLLLMILVPVQMTVSCCKIIPLDKWLFILLLAITLIGWMKVSSDIIMVYAPFLVFAFQNKTKKKIESNYPCTSSTT